MGSATIRVLHHGVLSQLVLRHFSATDSQHMFLHVLFCGALLFWRLLLEDKKKQLAHTIWFCVLTSAPCPQLVS